MRLLTLRVFTWKPLGMWQVLPKFQQTADNILKHYDLCYVALFCSSTSAPPQSYNSRLDMASLDPLSRLHSPVASIGLEGRHTRPDETPQPIEIENLAARLPQSYPVFT